MPSKRTLILSPGLLDDMADLVVRSSWFAVALGRAPTFLSLNEDVLREILNLVLDDTPRAKHKTAILLSCSKLHAIGLPLLHRVVDLTNLGNAHAVVDVWHGLFGRGGTLTREGNYPALHKAVHELRIGGPVRQRIPGLIRHLPS